MNPNANANITNKEKWSLEGKAKAGWRMYFTEREKVYDLQDQRDRARTTATQLRNNTPVDYEHLKQMFLDLYEKVGELCDCPICLETMTKTKTSVPLCGHLVCVDCRERIDTCPICRKKY
jgi:hypothetical protein